MQNRWIGLVLVLIVLGLGGPNSALGREKKGIGWVGLSRDFKVEGLYGRNSYTGINPARKLEGSQLWVNFEGGYLGKVSPMGNVGGVEFAAMMGYDGAFSDQDKVAVLGAFAYNIQVGFPFSLFHQFTDGIEWLQLAIAPGFGVDHLHAYLYIKGKAGYLLNENMTLEASYTWWPGPTSYTTYGSENLGLNLASAKGSVFIGRPNGTAIEVFAEHLWGEEELESEGVKDPKIFAGKNPFGQTARRECCTNLRFGAGIAF